MNENDYQYDRSIWHKWYNVIHNVYTHRLLFRRRFFRLRWDLVSNKRVEPSNGTHMLNLAIAPWEVYFGSDDGFVYSISESVLAKRWIRKIETSQRIIRTKSEVMVIWHGASIHPAQWGPNPCSAMTRTGSREMTWVEIERKTMNQIEIKNHHKSGDAMSTRTYVILGMDSSA